MHNGAKAFMKLKHKFHALDSLKKILTPLENTSLENVSWNRWSKNHIYFGPIVKYISSFKSMNYNIKNQFIILTCWYMDIDILFRIQRIPCISFSFIDFEITRKCVRQLFLLIKKGEREIWTHINCMH